MRPMLPVRCLFRTRRGHALTTKLFRCFTTSLTPEMLPGSLDLVSLPLLQAPRNHELKVAIPAGRLLPWVTLGFWVRPIVSTKALETNSLIQRSTITKLCLASDQPKGPNSSFFSIFFLLSDQIPDLTRGAERTSSPTIVRHN